MNVTEANAFNVICRHLGLAGASDDRKPTLDQATSAFATLAERSNKALYAGVSGGTIVAHRQRLAELVGSAEISEVIADVMKTLREDVAQGNGPVIEADAVLISVVYGLERLWGDEFDQAGWHTACDVDEQIPAEAFQS